MCLSQSIQNTILQFQNVSCMIATWFTSSEARTFIAPSKLFYKLMINHILGSDYNSMHSHFPKRKTQRIPRILFCFNKIDEKFGFIFINEQIWDFSQFINRLSMKSCSRFSVAFSYFQFSIFTEMVVMLVKNYMKNRKWYLHILAATRQ